MIRLELSPMSGKAWADIPLDVRLRRCLKLLGRHGLRCTRIDGPPTLAWNDEPGPPKPEGES
jgi:hypothetical protein